MNNADLVRRAVEILEITQEKARAMRVGELQSILRKHETSTMKGPMYPVGLTRMRHAELVLQCQQRNMSTADATRRAGVMNREDMIAAFKEHEDAQHSTYWRSRQRPTRPSPMRRGGGLLVDGGGRPALPGAAIRVATGVGRAAYRAIRGVFCLFRCEQRRGPREADDGDAEGGPGDASALQEPGGAR